METERNARCTCGKGHVVFESSSSNTGGMATETTVFACRTCGEPLFERNVRDGESIMLLADDDPVVEVIRSERRAAARRRWRPWTFFVRQWEKLEFSPVKVWLQGAFVVILFVAAVVLVLKLERVLHHLLRHRQ